MEMTDKEITRRVFKLFHGFKPTSLTVPEMVKRLPTQLSKAAGREAHLRSFYADREQKRVRSWEESPGVAAEATAVPSPESDA